MSTSSSEMYWQIPSAIAVKLLDCYFGGGPRHNEREARLGVDLPPPPAPGTKLPEPPDGEFDMRKVRLGSTMQSWIPRGAAVKPAPTPPDGA